MPSDADIYQPGIGWVPVTQIGKLPASYDPVRAREYTERGLPPAGPSETNVFGERGATIQGIVTPGERQFWVANPMGAVKHPQTGVLVGLGADESSRQKAIQSAFPAAAQFQETRTDPQVDADSLINQAISRRQELEGQRGGLENKRASLIQQYGALPRGPHGRETVQHRAITSQLHGLDLQERDLHEQETFADRESSMRLNSAFRNAAMAEKNLDVQRKEQTARDAASVLRGLSKIESQYKHGTPEYRQAVIDLTDANPMYIHSGSAASAVRKAAEFHDQRESRQVISRYSKLQGDIAAHEAASKLEEALNIKAGKANVPYTKSSDLNASRIEAAVLEKQFPDLIGLRPSSTLGQSPTIKVKDPQGRTGTIPASQLQDALQQGYQQVQ